MRILFATDAHENISTQLNIPNYAKLNNLDGVSIDFYNHNYADYDVVLFMGYDPRIAEARSAKPSLKIGVIDLRPSSIEKSIGADFVIANGLEMQDWLSDYFEHIFTYPIYPLVNTPQKTHRQQEPLILGYHGNKVHLSALGQGIRIAIETLSETYKLELWAVYDIQSLGDLPFSLFDPKKVPVRFFQWSEDVYKKVISKVDIGLVPNLIPIQEPLSAKQEIARYSSLFNPHDSDILLRYKSTTNPGRIYVFSQLGIPVVADYSPSATQALQHGVNGYLAYSTGGWYRALKSLAESAERRQQMGNALRADFVQSTSPEVLNPRLVNFIAAIPPRSVYPIHSILDEKRSMPAGEQSATVWQAARRAIHKLVKGSN